MIITWLTDTYWCAGLSDVLSSSKFCSRFVFLTSPCGLFLARFSVLQQIRPESCILHFATVHLLPCLLPTSSPYLYLPLIDDCPTTASALALFWLVFLHPHAMLHYNCLFEALVKFPFCLQPSSMAHLFSPTQPQTWYLSNLLHQQLF